MLVYAGLDEAGYGPMLGPLCVGATVFVLDDDAAAAATPARPGSAPNMWRLLDRAVCRSRRDRRRRIAIDDSKKLKGANSGGDGTDGTHPLRHLERGVLAMLGAAGPPLPDDDDALFAHLGVDVAAHAWYAGATPLPVGQTADELRVASARLARALAARGVRVESVRCEAVDVEAFNRGVEQAGAKSAVNFEAAMRHVDAIWRRHAAAEPRVVIDRHGGRTHYLEELKLAFPEASHRILDETDRFSRYRLERDGGAITLTFQTEADAKHLPVALASMAAKYVRELIMLRMNRFFQGHLPELKPTAGYVADARRYLRDVEPVLSRMAVARNSFVRAV